MNIKEFILYTQKADELIFRAFANIGFAVPEANVLFGHVLSAQHIWAKRMLGERPDYAVWEKLAPSMFIEIHQANMSMIVHVVATIPVTQEIHYSNSMGETFCNTVAEILLHICNHGTYHRGQLAKLLKQAGAEVPYTDYIILKRNGLMPNGEL